MFETKHVYNNILNEDFFCIFEIIQKKKLICIEFIVVHNIDD